MASALDSGSSGPRVLGLAGVRRCVLGQDKCFIL